MTKVAKTRLIAVVALLIAGSGLAYIAFGNIGKNLVYYWSPSEMLAQGNKAYGPTIRLGGIVRPGSLSWDAGHTKLTFKVADNHLPTAPSVEVTTTEVPPAMFREGIGVVVEGTFNASQVFTSNRLMVNHSNQYRPPKSVEDAAWKQTVAADAPKQGAK